MVYDANIDEKGGRKKLEKCLTLKKVDMYPFSNTSIFKELVGVNNNYSGNPSNRF